jgi:glycosyltransferase involved in cell wall biosynthesis
MELTCIIPIYNGESFVEEQLLSIINQSVKVEEIIIIDDFSFDNSLKIVNEIKEDFPERTILINSNSSNIGVVKCIELGIRMSHGDYIFFADQDDLWMPNKVEVFLEHVLKKESVELFYSDGYVANENLEVFATLSEVFYKDSMYSDKIKLAKSLKLSNFVPGCTILIKKSFALSLLPIPEGLLLHDGWFSIVAHLKNTSAFINDKLIVYRRHDKTLTKLPKLITFPKLKFYFTSDFESYLMSYINHLLLAYEHLSLDKDYRLVTAYKYFESLKLKLLRKNKGIKHLKILIKFLFLMIYLRELKQFIKVILYESILDFKLLLGLIGNQRYKT